MVAATQTTAKPRQQDGTIGADARMSDANRLFFLRIALIVIGLTFIFGIYTLGVVWPSGWAWGQGHSHYLMMIIAVYATLGVFLLIASRNPYAHKSLIWGVQAVTDPAERGHLVETGVAVTLELARSAALTRQVQSPRE
jgi:hypothetical protein